MMLSPALQQGYDVVNKIFKQGPLFYILLLEKQIFYTAIYSTTERTCADELRSGKRVKAARLRH